jgi:hypothetical protein
VITPALRYLLSPDLERPHLPVNPTDCAVFVQAMIGPRDGDGEESFGFMVVTPRHLARESGPVWGRGHLFLAAFSWEAIEVAVNDLIAKAAGQTWAEVGAILNRDLLWEFSDYREAEA